MGKFTFWVVLAGLVWLGWTLWRVGKRRAEAAERERIRDTPPPGGQPDSQAPEPMVSCEHCRVYLPAREAVIDGGRAFCSTGHRDAVLRAPRDGR